MEFVFNEYDYIVSLSDPKARTVSHVELVARDELLYRKTLSDEVLQEGYGYSAEQISIIRAYEGEAFSEAPELRGVFASVVGEISKQVASTTALTVKFEWYWDGEPLVVGLSDTVGMRWKGTNSEGAVMNLAFDENVSYATINYYYTRGDLAGTYYSAVHAQFLDIAPYEHTYIQFVGTQQDGNGNDRILAQSGKVVLRVVRPEGVTSPIVDAQFIFAYGHETAGINPGELSISFPLSFGISFDATTERMWYGGVTLNSNGTRIEYTPTT